MALNPVAIVAGEPGVVQILFLKDIGAAATDTTSNKASHEVSFVDLSCWERKQSVYRCRPVSESMNGNFDNWYFVTIPRDELQTRRPISSASHESGALLWWDEWVACFKAEARSGSAVCSS